MSKIDPNLSLLYANFRYRSLRTTTSNGGELHPPKCTNEKGIRWNEKEVTEVVRRRRGNVQSEQGKVTAESVRFWRHLGLA